MSPYCNHGYTEKQRANLECVECTRAEIATLRAALDANRDAAVTACIDYRATIGELKSIVVAMVAALDNGSSISPESTLAYMRKAVEEIRQESKVRKATIARLESAARDYEETIAANRRDYETLAGAVARLYEVKP